MVADGAHIAASIPEHFALSQNFPNPFNPRTAIYYALPEDAWVRMMVYDMTGRVICRLVEDVVSAGHHTMWWDGKDDLEQDVASGVYLYRLEINGGQWVQSRKMLLLR